MPSLLATDDLNRDGRADMIVGMTADASVSVSVILSSGATGFAPHVVYPLPAVPRALVVADFDTDGIPDFAVIPRSTGQLLTFSGRDGGAFVPGPSVSVARDSETMAVGDFDNDRRPDLLMEAFDNPLSLLLGSADGGFAGARAYDAGVRRFDIAGVADFDSDQNADVLLDRAVPGGQDLLILYGDGAANFTPSTPIGVEATSFVRVADVNGDGRPDIIGIKDYGAWFSSVVLLNRGARSFERGSEAGQMPTPHGLAAADLNADGRPELIVSFNSGVGVLMNRGDGSFLPPAMYGQFGPRAPVVADFTGDSVPDVAVCNVINASVSVFPNIGDGRLAAPRFYSDGPAVIHRNETLSLVDLDGDGSLDLADVVSELPQMSLFIRHNQGNGILGPPTLLPAPLTTVSLVALDVEDEGAIDLVTAEEAGTLSVFTNQRDAGFSPFRSLDAGFGAWRVQAADFNSDQRADLLFVGQNELEIFLNGPTLTGPVKLASSPGFFARVRPADFNRDGLQDLAALDGRGTLQTYLGLADGGLAPTATTLPLIAGFLEVGEFNGDGAPDLVVNGNRTLQVFLNARDGGFEAAAPVPVDGFVEVMSAPDLNGDGRSDLLVATNTESREPRTLTVLMSSPSATLTGGASFPLGPGTSDVKAGDLDGDGRADIALTTANGTQIFLNVCLP